MTLGNTFATWKHTIWKHVTWKHFIMSVGMVKPLGNMSFGNIPLGFIFPNIYITVMCQKVLPFWLRFFEKH